MKNTIKLFSVAALLAANACSFANKSTVIVPINSNPPGADVVIDGKNYGQTPALAELNPGKNHKATISKRGYGSVNIDMDTWYSVRDGEGADGKRCMADLPVLGIPYFIVLLFAPEKCASFKQSDYFVTLPGRNTGAEDLNNVPIGYNQNGYNQNGYSQNGYNQNDVPMNNSYNNSTAQYQNNYYQNQNRGAR